MPPFRKGKRKSLSELLDIRDLLRHQPSQLEANNEASDSQKENYSAALNKSEGKKIISPSFGKRKANNEASNSEKKNYAAGLNRSEGKKFHSPTFVKRKSSNEASDSQKENYSAALNKSEGKKIIGPSFGKRKANNETSNSEKKNYAAGLNRFEGKKFHSPTFGKRKASNEASDSQKKNYVAGLNKSEGNKLHNPTFQKRKIDDKTVNYQGMDAPRNSLELPTETTENNVAVGESILEFHRWRSSLRATQEHASILENFMEFDRSRLDLEEGGSSAEQTLPKDWLNFAQVSAAASTSTCALTPVAATTAKKPTTASNPLRGHHQSPTQLIYNMAQSGQPIDLDTVLDRIIQEGRAAPCVAPHLPVQSPAQPGENHDFEPVTVPRMMPHSPSRFVLPPEVEEEVLLDNIKEIRRDGPVPPGVSLRDHITPPNGHLYTIRFDEIGKPIGPNAGKFSVKCGLYARMGHLFPLDVMWKSQAKSAKGMALKDLSKTFQSRLDFDFAHCALSTMRLRLKEWRYLVKRDHYLPFSTYEERIANRHPRVEEGQWKRLVELWSSEAKMAESERNKANKGKQVIKHTLGRQSLSSLRDKMGDVLFSVAFVEGHKKAQGGYHNKETEALMEKVMSTQPTSSSNSIESLFNDIYRLQNVIEDEKGKKYHGAYCTGVGGGVTKRRLSHPDGVFQTLTQSYVNQLRRELVHAREEVERCREDVKCAKAEAEHERGKRVVVESNLKALHLKYESLEEVQCSTWQMFVDLQRQFNEFQRKILGREIRWGDEALDCNQNLQNNVHFEEQS